MFHWIGNCECHILPFSCDLPLFYSCIQRHSKVWFNSLLF
jgi:hypothetical protein